MLAAMVKIIVRWVLLAAALLFVAYVLPGVSVASFGSALFAAAVLGLLNALLRPVLVILTLPVTLITLGLFLFVINALMFYFAASLLPGFNVTGFVAALIGSLEFAKKLLDRAKVSVSPGIGFGDQGDDHVRFALIENESRIRQAVRGIKQMFKEDGLTR